jgi:hypothetical protein
MGGQKAPSACSRVDGAAIHVVTLQSFRTRVFGARLYKGGDSKRLMI